MTGSMGNKGVTGDKGNRGNLGDEGMSGATGKRGKKHRYIYSQNYFYGLPYEADSRDILSITNC